MRCFLGLELPALTKIAISDWLSQAMTPLSSPIPPENFHITTVFLGSITPRQIDDLTHHLSTTTLTEPFSLTLNCQGYFAKPKVAWVGTTSVPEPLVDLVKLNRKIARTCGIQCEESDYVPHVSVARKCATAPPVALYPPDISFPVETLSLFESVSGSGGVRYRSVAQWPLEMPLNPRKRRQSV